jgi:hypothetical protein
MARANLNLLALLVMTGALMGCGGGDTPPAKSPDSSAKSAAADKKKKSKKAKSADQQADQGDSATSAGRSKEEVFKPDRPPRDILTTEETTFVLKFEASEVGQKAEESCRESAEDDPKAFNECKAKARSKIGETIQHFKEKDGKWWWITYLRKGRQLAAIHRIQFEWGEETDNTITLLPQGKDEGSARMSAVPKKVVVTIPNSYQIMIEDPQHGKMYYSASIGLLGDKDK